jgi:hypothetical protein
VLVREKKKKKKGRDESILENHRGAGGRRAASHGWGDGKELLTLLQGAEKIKDPPSRAERRQQLICFGLPWIGVRELSGAKVPAHLRAGGNRS